MQYVEGQDLSELMRDHGTMLPWYPALKIIRLAARGLHAVHQQGLVHRDIKPSNIMLASTPDVYVMDFGLVRDDASDLTSTGDLLGTPPFMSPEQCRGHRVDHRSDIYSLGATLYSLITGQRPFEGSTLQVIRRVAKGTRPRPIREFVPDLPDEVVALIDKAMAIRAGNRFADAQQMSKAITHVLRNHQPEDTETWDNVSLSSTRSQPDPGSPEPTIDLVPLLQAMPIDSIPDQRRRWLGGSIALLLALLGLTIFVLGQSSGPPSPQLELKIEHSGMVPVPAGKVRLGNEESTLRRYFGQFSFSADVIDAMVATCLESPLEEVDVAEFSIDQYEVTNSEYAKFVNETRHNVPSYWVDGSPPPGKEQHPVVNITYNDAQAYADWSGKKLPTREQWTRAFRGDSDHLFPWGDTYEVTWIHVHDTPPAGNKTTAPVQSTPRDISPYQVYNLAGNASEFVRGTFYQDDAPYRMVKGGTFEGLGAVYALAPMFTRYGLDFAKKDTGFRCVIEMD